MKISKNVTNIILHVVMVIMLVFNLFPIGWMMYCSVKGNGEILSGEVAPRKAQTTVRFLNKEGDNFFIGTVDGALTKINKEKKEMKRFSLKSLSTSYFMDKHFAWIVSADKGLVKLDKNTFKKINKYELPLDAIATVELIKNNSYTTVIDVAQMGDFSMTGNNDYLWMAVRSVGIRKIIEFNKDTEEMKLITLPDSISFTQLMSLEVDEINNLLWIGTDKYLVKYDLDTGNYFKVDLNDGYLPPGAQKVFLLNKYQLLFQTSNEVYLVSTKTGEVLKKYFDGIEMTSSDTINDMDVYQSMAYLATNDGLKVLDIDFATVKNVDARFAKFLGNNTVDVKQLEKSPISDVFVDDGLFIVGATVGRATVYNSETNDVVDLFKTGKGHMLMFSRGWRNYIDMWPNVDFWKYLKNSLIICGITMIIAMILSTMTAYSLVRFDFPGKRIFSTSILVTQMIPSIFYLIPIFMLFNIIKDQTAAWEFMKLICGEDYNGIMIKGSYPGLIFIYSAWFLPFSIWILRGFFAAIPVDLEEAATIDGCSNFGVFWRITLPLAIPGIIATGIFVLIQAWDELMFAWMLTNEVTQTIPVGIRLFVGNFQNRYDLMMAAATIATLPVLILFFILQKHIVKGLTAGAVKG